MVVIKYLLRNITMHASTHFKEIRQKYIDSSTRDPAAGLD